MQVWSNTKDGNNHSLVYFPGEKGSGQLLFTVVKPGGCSCQKVCDIACTLDEIRAAFDGVGPAWVNQTDKQDDGTHFTAKRTTPISTSAGMLILTWLVDHRKLEDGKYELKDELSVETEMAEE